jgi:hypothetical protein
LTEVFAEKLKLEAPASYWETISSDARDASWKWLSAFTVAVLTPLGLAWLNWSELSTAVTTFLADTGIGGAAFISVLGIGYGWVLKHLSRGFVQNLLIADDAKQRNVMTMTYLALSKDADVEISNNERALILNALFRPAPPSNADDGPPASLLELLRK